MSKIDRSSENLIQIDGGDELRALLESHGLDTSQWGAGPTKPVDALWQEIDEGESEIIELDGEIVRRTNVAAVDVIVHPEDSPWLKLFEEKQVFNNGSERRRNLITSLAEKIRRDEHTTDAVSRALQEELGILSPASIEYKGEVTIEKDSQTYGGIRSQLLLRLALVELNEQDYNSAGYVEHQPDKSVYFNWTELGGENG